MFTLHIEHPISDYARWKAAFVADPLDRTGSGVRAVRIWQPVDDVHQVALDLDFTTRAQAEDLLERLRTRVWTNSAAAPALRVVDVAVRDKSHHTRRDGAGEHLARRKPGQECLPGGDEP